MAPRNIPGPVKSAHDTDVAPLSRDVFVPPYEGERLVQHTRDPRRMATVRPSDPARFDPHLAPPTRPARVALAFTVRPFGDEYTGDEVQKGEHGEFVPGASWNPLQDQLPDDAAWANTFRMQPEPLDVTVGAA